MDAKVRQWFMYSPNQLHVCWTADYSSIASSAPHHMKAESNRTVVFHVKSSNRQGLTVEKGFFCNRKPRQAHVALKFCILTNLECFYDGEVTSFAQETKLVGFWEGEIENL